MKQINNQTPTVHLSTYDNSDALLQVSEKYKNAENICVAVKFGDTIIKISSKELCKCNFNEAIEKHSEDLMSPVFWQIIGLVKDEVKDALDILGHERLGFILTNAEYNSNLAWTYNGNYGNVGTSYKLNSRSVRPAQVFQI